MTTTCSTTLNVMVNEQIVFGVHQQDQPEHDIEWGVLYRGADGTIVKFRNFTSVAFPEMSLIEPSKIQDYKTILVDMNGKQYTIPMKFLLEAIQSFENGSASAE